MKTIETELFGQVVVPEDISQIMTFLGEQPQRDVTESIYMWRGQGNIDWAIHSAAYRRLAGSKSAALPNEQLMRNYERDLLSEARHQGYGFEGGRKLTDFELLAKLQHHGAATRLIDVSRNMLVALWFTCSSEPEKTGLLFGLAAGGIIGLEGAYGSGCGDYNEKFPHADADEEDFNGVLPVIWQPPVVSKRIAAQSAQFVYSTVVHGTMGSLALDRAIHHKGVIAFAVTPELKRKFLRVLERVFDIRLITLFPDFDGFCRANGERYSLFSNYRW
ncbi:FRG domain-containing protein [Escherichia coli]|uniref:FRG domain-containing protein n=1 Tax=Escherichia coli TaxID=562 RepID=UPI0002CBC42E|nr:FRG domain-containing protein [Escherichia coli]ENC16003.1 FRG domain protein [Escherichia coli P0299438.6]